MLYCRLSCWSCNQCRAIQRLDGDIQHKHFRSTFDALLMQTYKSTFDVILMHPDLKSILMLVH